MRGIRRGVLLLIALCAGCTQAPGAGTTAALSPAVSHQAGGSQPASGSPASSAPPAGSSGRTTAARPTATRTTTGAGSDVPPLSAAARAAGLLDVRTVVPDAIIDLRYATSDNFVHVPLYPANARCLVHESLGPGLRRAAAELRRQGAVLVFWDCYRPHAVQARMFQIVPDPAWVARPGPYARSHEAARSVDVTLARAATGPSCPADRRIGQHCLLEMGTGFDDFTARAHAFASAGISTQARSNRAVLRAAMNAGGLEVYSGEWWHFDGPGAFVHRPVLDVPVG